MKEERAERDKVEEAVGLVKRSGNEAWKSGR